MARTPLYREIVSTLNAISNCRKFGNSEWLKRHEASLDWFEKQLPSGCGIDCGTTIDREKSNDSKLVLYFAFHHMDENGFYCGWSDYRCVVRPSLQFGIDVSIYGRNTNDIKEYLHEAFRFHLESKVWQSGDSVWHNGMFETFESPVS